jgi:hypothetical protein
MVAARDPFVEDPFGSDRAGRAVDMPVDFRDCPYVSFHNIFHIYIQYDYLYIIIHDMLPVDFHDTS